MVTNSVDQEARDLARSAVVKIETHELVCAQRWASTMKTMGEIKGILAWGISGLISSMAGLIVWLATHPH